MPLANKNPWHIAESDYPKDGSAAEKLRFLLTYAVLAPSRYNAQPWLFKITGSDLRLYADRTRSLPASDPSDRALIIGCGAALHYLGVAIRHFGHSANLHTFPDLNDEDLLAVVRLGPPDPRTREDELFFRALSLQPLGKAFEEQAELSPVDPEISRLGVDITRVADGDDRTLLEDIIEKALARESMNPLILAERASWEGQLRPAPDQQYSAPDAVHHQNGYALTQAHNGDNTDSELVVVGTAGDNTASWLAAGRALAFAMLRATMTGRCASPIHAPIESEYFRSEITERLGLATFPQVLVRLESGVHPIVTPRRPVHDVLLTQRQV